MIQIDQQAGATTQRAQRAQRNENTAGHRIVIVGGGVGGLGLATRLSASLGRAGLARIVLVDRWPTHFWKPLLHEAASGQLDPATHQLQYAVQAQRHGFEFEQGELTALDRAQRHITVSALRDADGREILPARQIAFDTLVLAMGSVTQYFGVPGAAEHALPLESVAHAEAFRRKLLDACLRASHARRARTAHADTPVSINIVGAGATGVELAAALRDTVRLLNRYSPFSLDPARDFRIRLIEISGRVLPALSESISARAEQMLESLGVQVLSATRVTEVRADAVLTDGGTPLASDIAIWTAGIAGPPVLRTLDGIAVNRNAQINVNRTLQCTNDANVFGLGDCAACPADDAGTFLAPRAQVAHQQALFLARALKCRVTGKALPEFVYRDAGTLVGFGREGAIGNLSSGLLTQPVFVDGWFASAIYKLIYRRHVMTLTGFARMALDTASHWLRRRVHPVIRLH
ncbi:NADH dehydrogenase, FAD-containing subunit [Burkholderia sp. Ch1-1]|uniref:NADH dehydrogenase, FAD-containing subunit n=1 Tax=Paraburkholderia dioscoreae TaxID=2604047 RepID=A0A5Q4Z1W7_9BURK|nr:MULTISPECIES: NAD(P)/FAD-dependent oxidoreductase [Paraburkholderia]EIF31733.1 NADH dehydrogenase, FAD-containing subunit [Burkholderia sp. Ch1-1]MDR8397951.1 NAD(P)/FAD-dependent oxidoreductase [Paraburkholderia sp. USG1]VVD27984.1 NADH dehydrogenase, FAD-containing subunit [Paraburkholderia dioscoreae]